MVQKNNNNFFNYDIDGYIEFFDKDEKLIELIKERIGEKENQKYISDYFGFDMSKTHSQEEENIKSDIRNKQVLNLFNDFKIENLPLDSWKGVMYLGTKENYLKEFGGWTTSDIIYWLIMYKKLEEEDEEYNRIIKEQINEESQKIIKNELNLYVNNIARIITKEDRYNVLKRQKWRCNQCGCILKYSKDSSWKGEVAHIDHIFPYSRRTDYPNGEENINELCNLQGLCPSCNLKKGKKEVN